MQKYVKKTKKNIAIKIFCFALSGLLLSSSVFMSNYKTLSVNAMTEEEYNHSLLCIQAISAVIGIWNVPAGIIFDAIATTGLTILDFIQDNGDGTYTIDAELVQAVNEVICDDSPKFTMHDTMSFIDSCTEEDFYQENGYDISLQYINTYGMIQFNTGGYYSPSNPIYNYAYTPEGYQTFYVKSTNNGFDVYIYSPTYGYRRVSSFYICDYYNAVNDGVIDLTGSTVNNRTDIWYSSVYTLTGAPIMVFDTVDDGLKFLGDSDFEYSRNFTGQPYTGGNITISANKLDGIEAKIDELNATTKSIDEKMDDLLEYLEDDDDDDDSVDDDDDDDSGGGSTDDDNDDDDDDGGFLSSLGEFIGKIFDFILSLIEMLFEPILKLLDMFMELINKVIDIIPTGFTSFLGAMFPFFPEEWVTIISLGLLIVIIIAIVRRK